MHDLDPIPDFLQVLTREVAVALIWPKFLCCPRPQITEIRNTFIQTLLNNGDEYSMHLEFRRTTGTGFLGDPERDAR